MDATTCRPSLPSALLALGIRDLCRAGNDPRYEIDMSHWHKGTMRPDPYLDEDKCHVCMAGAVIAMTLGLGPECDADLASFSGAVAERLSALNAFREGRVAQGLLTMGCLGNTALNRDVADYEEDPEQFLEDMQDLVRDLEAEEL